VRAHFRGEDDGLVRTRPALDRLAHFADLLETEADDPAFAKLRRSELIGRPRGSADFIRRAEAQLGRTLAPGKRGPKPKKGLGAAK
jgi:putative transposase